MYHQIAFCPRDQHGLCVAPDRFREHMRQLVLKGYNVLPLHEVARITRDAELPGRTVALTFDDGYLDALTCTTQSLSEFSFPATFFIVGAALERGYEFWWDTLGRVFRTGHPLAPRLRLEWPDDVLELETLTDEQRHAAQDRISQVLYRLPTAERNSALKSILDWSHVGEPGDDRPRPMAAEELIRLAQVAGVTIGAHTENHLWLPSISPEERCQEVEDSKRRLERLLARPVTSFSYPYGAYDAATTASVGRAGFECAVTTEERPAGPDDDPLLLPRWGVQNWEGSEFVHRLEQIFDSGAGPSRN